MCRDPSLQRSCSRAQRSDARFGRWQVGSMKEKLREMVEAARGSSELILSLQDQAEELEQKQKELELWRSRISHNYLRPDGESGAEDMVDWHGTDDKHSAGDEPAAAARELYFEQANEHLCELDRMTEPILATHIPERRDGQADLGASLDWIDATTGPLDDYDYTLLDHLGHSGVSGYSPIAKKQIARLREDAATADALRQFEEDALHEVRR